MKPVPILAATDKNLSVEQITDSQLIEEKYSSYLGDESKVRAKKILGLAFPKTAEEVSFLLADNYRAARCSTISGGRTGITAASVPEENSVLVSLERLQSISDVRTDPDSAERSITVGAGLTLNALQKHLSEEYPGLYFPVDPTETWAAIGGMASTNASGARTYHYGPMRDWIKGAEIVLADGTRLKLRRGEYRAEKGSIFWQRGSETEKFFCESIPKPKTKNTIGYCYCDDADPLDIFVGAEGTLGVFTSIELKLVAVPKNRLFYLQFFPSEDSALDFVLAVRESQALRTLAVEFLDESSLRLVPSDKCASARMIDNSCGAAVYLELLLESEGELGGVYDSLEELVIRAGAKTERSFAGTTERELREIKVLRHAVPEHINLLIAQRRMQHPELHKLATDMAVPDNYLKEIFYFYREMLLTEKLEFAIFGHAADNHFHVNFMPRDAGELKRAKEIYRVFAERVVTLGGAVAAEHGIGRLKKDFLKIQYDEKNLNKMKQIKSFFDKSWLLNRGVLLDQ